MSKVQYWTQSMEKQVGRRVQIILDDPVLLKLYQKFGGEIFRRSSIFHDLEKFLKEQNVRGKCCFEIGTWNGLTAVILSRFFDHVITVDIANQPLKHEILKEAGVTNVECLNIASNADKKVIVDNWHFDFAYMDGDHAHDTETDFALVKKCKRVLFHEAWEQQPPVWKLLNSLPLDQVTFGGAGLALWVQP